MNNHTPMRVPIDFKVFIKKAAINHGYSKKLEDTITQAEMQLRIVKYFKLNNDSYIEMINMVDEKC
jgi:hypothetical protein